MTEGFTVGTSNEANFSKVGSGGCLDTSDSVTGPSMRSSGEFSKDGKVSSGGLNESRTVRSGGGGFPRELGESYKRAYAS